MRDWLSAIAVGAGLVLVLTAYGTSPLTGAAHRHRVLLVMAGVVALIVILRQVSRHTAPWRASLLIGVAAGLCHALNAVYLKLTVEDLYHGGVPAAVLDWPVYALAATALAGMLLGQIAFASGPLPPAVAAMSITNPVGVLAAIALSGVLIALGVVGLAHASSTRRLYRASAHKNAATSSTSTGAPDGSDCTPIALRAGSPSGPRAAEIAADAPSATGDRS
jgi:hypothetical protein